MWFIACQQYKPEMYSAIEDFSPTQRDDRNTPSARQHFVARDRVILKARVHGCPWVNSATIGWMDGLQDKRDYDVWRVSTDQDGGPAPSQEALAVPVPVTEYVEGSFNIVDIDDPELVQGEDYLHDRLTSQLGEPFSARAAGSPDPTLPFLFEYNHMHFCKNLAAGVLPGVIILEPFRQFLGFPYEWVGADVD